MSFVFDFVLPACPPFCLPLPPDCSDCSHLSSLPTTSSVAYSSSQPAALASRAASLPSSLAFPVGEPQVQDRSCLLPQRQKICWSVTSCAGTYKDSHSGTLTHVSSAPSILSWRCYLPHDSWHSHFPLIIFCHGP